MSGLLVPWSKKDGHSFKNIFEPVFFSISILPGDESVVYMKRNLSRGLGTPPSKISLRLYSEKKMYEEINRIEEAHYLLTIKNAAFFGVLLWVAIFNFFFFSIVKERVYLYFALYVFLLGFARFAEPMYHLVFRELPSTSIFIVRLCWLFTAFVLTYFFRNLLKTYLYFPLWDKLLIIINGALFIVCAENFFLIIKTSSPTWLSVLNDIQHILSIILYLLLLMTLLLVIRKPEKSSRSMMIALLPPFGTWVICWVTTRIFPILERRFGIHFPPFFNWLSSIWWNIEIICLICIVFYFSWVLIERFNELRKQVVQKELEKEIERSQLIAQQKENLEIQVTERTSELSHSLKLLKATQNQLIQSEKLASLGELTAGIAHEIQNPLNFVNNFSELSVDLAKDITSEIHQPNVDTEYVEELLTALSSNQEKINHHGKRASSIVKGMLEHSRPNTGVRELTDINKLCNEYSRLAYNSLSAKDKDFKYTIETHFDESLPNIEVVPQDIGRVIVNLINNAFYAVSQRKDALQASPYQPSVTVTTQKIDNAIEIRIKDNGTGMSEAVRAKVFQPFFTTKPTGQGTGLGLSLAYDIITKGHSGTLTVESTEGIGSEFVITLPI